MATTSDLRSGLCIDLNNTLYTVVEFQHVKPGKGGAFVRTKLKGVVTGKVIDKTFNAGSKLSVVRVERRAHQFLYRDTTGYHFMDKDSFDQCVLVASLINAPLLLKEGQDTDILFHQENATPLSCELPPFVILKVTYTEPGVKGNTVNKTLKPATLETGAQVQVPLFIDQDDLIKIDTRTSTYAERVKK
jgi:elongation factor P